jgi:hypothetical protein
MKLLDEGKTIKYLKYAIGEIVLIITGILIAVQISNWNEDRKAQAEFDAYIVQLREDVREAIRNAEENSEGLNKRAEGGFALLELLKADDIQPDQVAVLERELTALGRYSEIQVHIGLLGRFLDGDVEVISRDDELLKVAMSVEVFLERRLSTAGHIYDKLDLASQSLLEFRGAYSRRLGMELMYDVDELKRSKKFQYTAQNIISQTGILSFNYGRIEQALKQFLTVLEDYE